MKLNRSTDLESRRSWREVIILMTKSILHVMMHGHESP